jgi:hypothetical protein
VPRASPLPRLCADGLKQTREQFYDSTWDAWNRGHNAGGASWQEAEQAARDSVWDPKRIGAKQTIRQVR